MKRRILAVILMLIMLSALIVQPAYAIGNPTSIGIGYYKVFYDVVEAGDMLFVCEGRVVYAVTPTDYLPSEAFIYDILSAADVSLVSTPLQAWGYRPISIYLSAATVTAGAWDTTGGTVYKMRISPNPLILASVPANTITQTLIAANYIDQNLGIDIDPPTDNNLYLGMRTTAQHMETKDAPTSPYLIMVDGYDYLTTVGEALFLRGIPGLKIMCPIFFQYVSQGVDNWAQEDTGTYVSTLSIAEKWGSTAANGLTMLGSYLGLSQKLAGSVMLFVLTIAFAVFIYQKTESGVVVLLMVAACPFVGAFLGLMPLALAFILVVIVVILISYFFYSRGAL